MPRGLVRGRVKRKHTVSDLDLLSLWGGREMYVEVTHGIGIGSYFEEEQQENESEKGFVSQQRGRGSMETRSNGQIGTFSIILQFYI